MKEKLVSNKIRIPSDVRERIIQGVVKKLKLKDYFQLKDRLDGEFYLRKQFKRIFTSYFFERNLRINLLDPEKPLYCKSEFELDGINYSLVGTYNPNKIKIPKKDNTDIYLVVKVSEFPPEVEFLGSISYVECMNLASKKEKIQSNNAVVEEPLIILERKDLKDLQN